MGCAMHAALLGYAECLVVPISAARGIAAMKKIVQASLLSFFAGFIVHAAVGNGALSLFNTARAEVAGMDHRDLLRDRDFRKAVQQIAGQETRRIVADCLINGYVDGRSVFGQLNC